MESIIGYEIQKKLGAGSHGNTYLGHKDLEQACIKVIDLKETRDWKSWDMGEREADTIKGLNHPGIVGYCNFIKEESRVIICMEYIAGSNMVGKQLPKEDVVEFLRQMKSVLEYLNSKGIVHRDIKPANIIKNPQGNYVLVDFGIAGDMSKKNGSTIAGYTPWECFGGERSNKTDLFSVGVVASVLLSGKEPEFQSMQLVRPRECTDNKLWTLIQNMTVVKPEDRSWRGWEKIVPKDLTTSTPADISIVNHTAAFYVFINTVIILANALFCLLNLSNHAYSLAALNIGMILWSVSALIFNIIKTQRIRK